LEAQDTPLTEYRVLALTIGVVESKLTPGKEPLTGTGHTIIRPVAVVGGYRLRICKPAPTNLTFDKTPVMFDREAHA